MAEPLKNLYGPEVPRRIGAMISAVHPRFPARAFVREALDGYGRLELLDRGWRMADALRRHLPEDYERAVGVLVASLGPKLESTERNGLEPFLYLPHVFFVARYGLEHFEPSMLAQYELTQRFSAEFSIRPFLERYPEAALERLRAWTRDPNPHVRRLVSEGTRPRLPWAPRLREFQRDPSPVLALLELLKDDPDEYVRRSVANNLNDIGKDHPELLVATARRWMKDAPVERRRLVRHALRSSLKRGEAGALRVLGYRAGERPAVGRPTIEPRRPSIGGSVRIGALITNRGSAGCRVMVDARIGFVRANGTTGPRVFKLKSLDLAPGESAAVSKRISLAPMTTRRHYPGRHPVDIVVNGVSTPIGSFTLVKR